MTFSKGDKVRVIPNAANIAYIEGSRGTNLKIGEVYTVDSPKEDAPFGDEMIHLVGHATAHTYESRFELYYPCIEVKGVQPSNTFLDKQPADRIGDKLHNSIRNKNVGNSNYATYDIQPYDIWEEYNLNPWDADVVKRILRTKEDVGMTPAAQRILDYQKIKHICDYAIDRINTGKDTRF